MKKLKKKLLNYFKFILFHKIFIFQLVKKIFSLIVALNLFFRFKLNNKKKEINLVYDLKDSPATYGDFFNFIILFRYFEITGYKVNVHIISDELRASWERLKNTSQKKKLISNLIKLANNLKVKSQTNIINCSWDIFFKNFQNKNIFLSDWINARIRIYDKAFNILQFLRFYHGELLWKNIILKKNSKVNNNVTLHVRYTKNSSYYSKKVSSDRDISLYQLQKILKILSKKYAKIIILTDETGYINLKKIKKKFKKVIFSKEISKSFTGDIQLLLKSRKYYCFKGGGMNSVAVMTNLPLLIGWNNNVGNEFFWNSEIYSSWQLKNQTIKENVEFNDFINMLTQDVED
jgi:hypothetical protein